MDENGFGHEVFNFRIDFDGRYRGYVRPPGGRRVGEQQINITRLSAPQGAESVRGVQVFWVATDPLRGGTRVVGWYEDATVFRKWRRSPRKRALPDGSDAGFMIEAKRARLLLPDDRTFVLPRATQDQTGVGQSNVWYPPSEWCSRLLEYRDAVLGGKLIASSKPAARAGRLADTEQRLLVERNAMNAVAAWCAARGLAWEDVSLRRLGWDIEARDGRAILRIEVKGSSAPLGDALLELTPNEFAMMRLHRATFRIAAVSVINGRTKLAMFAWSDEAGAWVTDGYSLRIDEVVSARVALVKE